MKKTLLLSALIIQFYCCSAQWYQTNGPEGGYSNCIVSNGSYLFCSGGNNGIYRSADNGASWEVITNNIKSDYFLWTDITCMAVQNGTVFAGSEFGVIRSADNGNTWTVSDSGLSSDSYVATIFVNDTDIFVGNINGIYISKNGGKSWQALGNPVLNAAVDAIAVSGDTLYAGSNYSEGPYMSPDYGAHWVTIDSDLNKYGSPLIYALEIVGNNVFAGTDMGMYELINDNLPWKEVSKWNGPYNIGSQVNAFALSGNNFYAASGDSGMYISTDGGNTWTPLNTGMKNVGITSMALSGDNIFVSTYNGLYTTSNGGAQWQLIDSGYFSQQVPSMLWNEGKVFAGTQYGLFSSTDNGNSWSLIDNGIPPATIYGIAANSIYVFALTTAGIFRSADNGVTWVKPSSSIEFPSRMLVFGDTLFVGANGDVYRSIDDGTSWIKSDSGININNLQNSEAFCKVGDTIIFSTQGGIYASGNYGLSWKKTNSKIVFGSYDEMAFFAVCDTNIFAGSSGGGLFVSSIHNIYWQPYNTPFSSYRQYASLVLGDSIYIGCESGFYLSTNKGVTWHQVDSSQLFSSIAVNSLTASGSYVFAGTYGASVWANNISFSTSIEQPVNTDDVLFYPNPAGDKISIAFDCNSASCFSKNSVIQIYNLMGELAVSEPLTQNNTDINISNLSSGIYLVKITDETGATKVKKFVKE